MNSENILRKVYCWGWHTPAGIWRNILRTKYLFKWTYQRFARGYADCDIWNFDGFLATVISSGLRDLAELHSYPFGFGSHEEWSKWLIETAELFEETYNEDFIITGEEYQQKINKAFDRLKEQFGNLWD